MTWTFSKLGRVLNHGIADRDGNEEPLAHNIYVDDNLMADIRRRMPPTLAAGADVIFTIMGFPNLLMH